MSVLTVTVNPALDVSLTVDALVPEHKLLATTSSREPGGGGVNVSRVLARLGEASVPWVAVGGGIGDEYLDLLGGERLEPVAHRISGTTRESVSITDRARNLQYRVVVTGPVIDDPGAALASIVEAAEAVDVIVLSGSVAPGLGHGFYAEVVEAIRDAALGRTAKVIVDCSGPALDAVLQTSADLVKPSRRELASLVPWVPADLAEVEVAARQVLDRSRVGALAVSLGAEGALFVARAAAPIWYEPPPIDKVESTVGAGDSMVAGIVAGVLLGENLAEAVRRGVAAGTAAALTPGTDLCHPADVERLLPAVVMSAGPPR